MARKILISFLGTTNYVSCNYYDEDNHDKIVKDVRFIQEAVIKLFCNDFDAYYFFLTDEAKEKNWLDDGHQERDGSTIITGGLKSRLKDLSLKGKVHPIRIEEGFSTEEIWQIFNKVFSVIENEDIVTFDITHGFRSLPMLGMVLINYAKTLKNISVSGIHYGAFEILGKMYEVKNKEIEERNAPILNLFSFSELQEWSSAAYEFISYGVSKGISNLINRNSESERVNDFKTKLNRVTKSISTVRGSDIIEGTLFKDLKKSIEMIKVDDSYSSISSTPLFPLLEKIDQKILEFNHNPDINNGFIAVQWCIDNNLTQQGITFLQEFLIIYCLKYIKFDRSFRGVMSSCLNVKSKSGYNFSKNSKSQKKQSEILNLSFKEPLLISIRSIFNDLTKLRNDINHAGLKNPSDYDVFNKELSRFFKLIKRSLKRYQHAT